MERHFCVTENNFDPFRFPYRQVSLYTANCVKYEVCKGRTDFLREIYEMFVQQYISRSYEKLRIYFSKHNLGYLN